MKRLTIAVGLMLATSTGVLAVPNPGILYPDHSYHYAIGYPNIDFPVVHVARGTSVEVVIDRGEDLIVKDNVPVILDDRTRWVAVGSRVGGQRLPNGQMVPVTWSVIVEPGRDAEDTWLTINTAMGNRYKIHLIAVDHRSKLAENLIGFYLYHPPQKRSAPRSQARERDLGLAPGP